MKTATSTSTAKSVYYGSDGGATRSYCRRLEATGHRGRIAAQLFRVQKASSRAKVYRGGIKRGGQHTSYRSLAYDRKGECIEQLCHLLDADNCGLAWGWAVDPTRTHAAYILYVDLPQGQVSFHSTERYVGLDYGGKWDGQHGSETRIIAFCDYVMASGQDQGDQAAADRHEESDMARP